ncbi:MAG: restriction endonuclease subunit S [Candidatus Nanopelagicales bacterium]
MPKGWDTLSLDELADLYDGPHATPTKTDAGPWYLSISSLDNGRFDLGRSAHLSETQFRGWTRRVQPCRGDTLFSYETRVGEAAYWNSDEPAALGRRMGLLRAKDGVCARFLTYAFLGPQFQEVIRANTVHGATVERLLIADMPSWRISIPRLDEQQRIAEVLGSLDDLIEANDAQAARAEALAAAIFERAAFDIEGADGETLSSALDVNPVRPRPAAEAPYVDMAALSTTSARITAIARRAPVGGARFVNGDTLMARITPCLENGKIAFVDQLPDGEVAVGSTEFLVLRPREPLTPEWAYCLARSPRFRDYTVQRMSGSSGRQRASAADVAAYPIRKPNESEARAFNELVSPLFAAMKQMGDEADQLRATRHALLPLLMSGKVRAGEVAA